MKIGPIVLKLRLAETQFGNKIAGAAELDYALRGTLQEEMAFVIQLAEAASPNELDAGINQKVTESFGVIVMLNNATSDKDKTGLTAYDSLYDVRTQLFSALLGWQIPGTEDLVSYAGGSILGINRAQFWYQFEFKTVTRIDDDDGVDVGADELATFDSIYAQWAITGPSGKEFADWGDFGDSIYPPDMESMVDFTDNPKDGEFGKGFGIKFDVSEH